MKSAISFFKRILFFVQVTGESCWPDLIPSKKYLATSLLRPKIGDYIIFRTKYDEIFVKKVKYIKKKENMKGDDSYFVSGNVSWAQDSNSFGLIKKENILGKLI